jgi:hypothetical protein
MDWSLLYELVSRAATIPLVAAGIGGLIGAGVGSLCTHYFTQKREETKRLREKAEALIGLLAQSRYRLVSWHLAIDHQAEYATYTPMERPTILLLDIDQMSALQRLHFPAVDLQTFETTLIEFATWLENQWNQQHRDFPAWCAQFRREEGALRQDAYSTACEETIEAVVRVAPPSRTFARAMVRRWHQQ